MKRGILLAVFAVIISGLIVAYLLLINRPEPPPPPLPDENEAVHNVPDEDVVEIKLQTPETELFLQRQGERWIVPGQEEADLDPNKILTVVSMVARLWARDVVAESAEDLSIYGLDRGDIVGRVTLKDGTERIITFGNRTPSRTTDYVMIDGDPRVFTVWQNNKNQMAWTIEDLRRIRRLPRIETQTMNRLVVKNENGEIEIVRYYEPHGMPYVMSRDVMVKPYSMHRGADSEQIEELINAASAIRADEFIADRAEDLAAYGLAVPRLELILHHGRGVFHVKFGNSYGRDKLYMKLASDPIVYGIDERDVQSFFDVQPFDLVSRFLALVTITSVDRVIFEDGEKTYTLDITWEGDDVTFKLNGAKLPEDPAKSLYQELIGLMADLELPGESSQGEPTLRIRYDLQSGPLDQIMVGLIRYDRDFYVAEVNGAQEFLVAVRAVERLPDAIKFAMAQTE